MDFKNEELFKLASATNNNQLNSFDQYSKIKNFHQQPSELLKNDALLVSYENSKINNKYVNNDSLDFSKSWAISAARSTNENNKKINNIIVVDEDNASFVSSNDENNMNQFVQISIENSTTTATNTTEKTENHESNVNVEDSFVHVHLQQKKTKKENNNNKKSVDQTTLDHSLLLVNEVCLFLSLIIIALVYSWLF
jgi:hypothetical protein